MTRPTVQRLCLATALVSLLVAGAIGMAGGYEFTLLGLTIRGHRIDRLIWLAGLAVAGYILAGGRGWRWAEEPLSRCVTAVAARPDWVAAAVASVVFGGGLVLGSRAVGGSDSYGYMSQAHLWLRASFALPQPWITEVPWPLGADTFQPLGYVTRLDTSTLVPIYSPGLPILMAAAMAMGGACAAFYIVPALGAVAVFATYRLGRAVASAWVGVAAAWMLATSPTFVHTLMQPMSDLPVTAAWVAAFLAACRGTRSAAVTAGLLAGGAVLIRVNHAPLILPLIVWFIACGWRGGERSRWDLMFWHVAALLPGIAAAAAFNWHFHGSPFRSGYGPNQYLFTWENVGPNVGLYAAWLTDTQTPLVWLGVAAVFLPIRRLWPDRRGRLMVASAALFVLALWAEYCFYGVFADWWYLRFLLPAFPIVLIGLAQVASIAARSVWRPFGVIVVLAVLVVPSGLGFARDLWVLGLRSFQGHYALAARVAESATEPASVIYSMQHSGSLRYYAGRMTLRYDFLDPAWLDLSVGWLQERGVHAYALLEPWEVGDWRRRFGNGSAIGRLELRPIRLIGHNPEILLYDLLASGVDAPRAIGLTAGDLECRPPAPIPSLAMAQRP